MWGVWINNNGEMRLPKLTLCTIFIQNFIAISMLVVLSYWKYFYKSEPNFWLTQASIVQYGHHNSTIPPRHTHTLRLTTHHTNNCVRWKMSSRVFFLGSVPYVLCNRRSCSRCHWHRSRLAVPHSCASPLNCWVELNFIIIPHLLVVDAVNECKYWLSKGGVEFNAVRLQQQPPPLHSLRVYIRMTNSANQIRRWRRKKEADDAATANTNTASKHCRRCSGPTTHIRLYIRSPLNREWALTCRFNVAH